MIESNGNFNVKQTPPRPKGGVPDCVETPVDNLPQVLDDVGLELRMPERFRWDEIKKNGDTVLHYSTSDKYNECKNKKFLKNK